MSARLTRSTEVRTAPSGRGAAGAGPPPGGGAAGAGAPWPGGERARGPGWAGRGTPVPARCPAAETTAAAAPAASSSRAASSAVTDGDPARSRLDRSGRPGLPARPARAGHRGPGHRRRQGRPVDERGGALPQGDPLGAQLHPDRHGAGRGGRAGGRGPGHRVQGGQVGSVSLDPQRGGHPLQLGEATAGGYVHRDREVVPAAQVVRHERRELTGPDLEEHPEASVVHRGQGAAEPDRLLQLPVQQLEPLLLAGRERRRDRRRPDGYLARPRPGVPRLRVAQTPGARRAGAAWCATACPRRRTGPARRPGRRTGCARPW